jgi:hypothetical protein
LHSFNYQHFPTVIPLSFAFVCVIVKCLFVKQTFIPSTTFLSLSLPYEQYRFLHSLIFHFFLMLHIFNKSFSFHFHMLFCMIFIYSTYLRSRDFFFFIYFSHFLYTFFTIHLFFNTLSLLDVARRVRLLTYGKFELCDPLNLTNIISLAG